mmetsp:Transcript_15554/g.22868  ORF Transcript_15554/g.22868 Transcript_15554/m.22868 type:complete len:136 (+) Transcript_15554:480-887(+)
MTRTTIPPMRWITPTVGETMVTQARNASKTLLTRYLRTASFRELKQKKSRISPQPEDSAFPSHFEACTLLSRVLMTWRISCQILRDSLEPSVMTDGRRSQRPSEFSAFGYRTLMRKDGHLPTKASMVREYASIAF